MTTLFENLRQTARHHWQDAPALLSVRLVTAFREVQATIRSPASLGLVALALLIGFGAALALGRWPGFALAAPTVANQMVVAANGQPPGQPPPCRGLKVWFSEMATLGEIVALLGEVAAGIASGPNRDGSFELTVPEAAAPAVAESLAQLEGTVEGVFFVSSCSRS